MAQKKINANKNMINSKEFLAMKKDLEKADLDREKTMQASRELIQMSKKVIYATHRGDLTGATKYAKEMKKMLTALKKLKGHTGLQRAAYQEYAEAVTYLYFVEKGKLLSKKQSLVDTESYLLGLCDLTGELMRKAVNSVIADDFTMVDKCHKLVTSIYAEFLNFDLRNGELRKKSDAIKWNLTKIEDVVFKLKLRDGAED